MQVHLSPTINRWPKIESGKAYYFEPGDYNHLPPLKLSGLESVMFNSFNGAIVPGFEFHECCDFTLFGFVNDGMIKLVDCTEMKFVKFVYPKVKTPTGVRISNCNDLKFYDFDFLGRVQDGQDKGGFLLSATGSNSTDDILIKNCKFFNIGGVGCTRLTGNSNQIGTVDRLVIEDCHFQITPDQRHEGLYKDEVVKDLVCSESFLDFKTGSNFWELRNKIVNCTFIGARPTDTVCGGTGNPGTSIVVHRNAKNYEISFCKFIDNACGVSVFPGGKKGSGELVENIYLRDSFFINAIDSLSNGSSTGVHIRKASNQLFETNNSFYGLGKERWEKPGLEYVKPTFPLS